MLSSSMTKIFLLFYVNIAIMIILMYAKIDELSIPEGIPIFNGRYRKFNLDWY